MLAFVKHMLYSHCTQNCIILYFFEANNPCFVTKKCSESSYNCVFIVSQNSTIDFTKTFITRNGLSEKATQPLVESHF